MGERRLPTPADARLWGTLWGYTDPGGEKCIARVLYGGETISARPLVPVSWDQYVAVDHEHFAEWRGPLAIRLLPWPEEI